MPGWYVHMEAAARTAARLRAADVPPGFPVDPAEVRELGRICHVWRNYLAVGALGPDLFYILPDFSGTKGTVIRQVVQWALDVWSTIDEEFVSTWERWVGPIQDNASGIENQLTGGLLNVLGQALSNLGASVTMAVEGLITSMGDWFGVLTSGVPQGYGDSAFYWSDMFHYRRTTQYAFALFRTAKADLDAAVDPMARQDAEARLAFAIGWLTHCATDTTGHPFTNAKCGGPYRDHWQRHHLIENHIDAQAYTADNPGPLFDEYGTSALHFRVAFRAGRPDYPGRSDAPAYDYTTGFPAYPTGHDPGPTAARNAFFDLDSGPLPRHLTQAMRDTMQAVFGADGPKILAQDPAFSAVDAAGMPDGRPNDAALDEMWSIVYAYLAMTSRDGLSPYAPTPPPVINDHSFPEPPGGDYGVDDDPTRGADPSNSSFDLLDLLLALFAWAVYIAEVAIWLATVLPGLIVDITTFPLRLVLYYAFVVPSWDLYLLSRRTMVMTGFLMPNRSEIDLGLTTMGQSPGQADSFIADLDDPSGFAPPPPPGVTEPSGRPHANAQFGLDGGYPRNIVRDDESTIGGPDVPGMLGLTGTLHYANDTANLKPSEWLKPWNYPLRSIGGLSVPREDAPVHVGPFVIGDTGTILLTSKPGHPDAWRDFEKAATPAETALACARHLPRDEHLGGPVDYGTYLVVRFLGGLGSAESPVPDFNLDSDKGYAWHAWDWERHASGALDAATGRRRFDCRPDIPPPPVFDYRQPCTPPQFFHANRDNPTLVVGGVVPESQWYDGTHSLAIRYRGASADVPPDPDGPDPCGDVDLSFPGGIEWPRPSSWSPREPVPPEPHG